MDSLRGLFGKERRESDYPTNLDCVDWEGSEYQVVGMAQTGNISEDRYLLNQTSQEQPETFRVKGARFERYKKSREPEGLYVYRRDEGVKKTGALIGGEKE